MSSMVFFMEVNPGSELMFEYTRERFLDNQRQFRLCVGGGVVKILNSTSGGGGRCSRKKPRVEKFPVYALFLTK